MMVGVLVAGVVLGGCVERRLSITTEPTGATVWVNDTRVGLSPVETTFLYHGEYDVRVELDGYEPLMVGAEAVAPWWEYPPIDLIAEALPFTVLNEQSWHFELAPSLERQQGQSEFEAGLLERATEMRQRTGFDEDDGDPGGD